MRLTRVVLPALVALAPLATACADESDMVMARAFVELGTGPFHELEAPVWTGTDEAEDLERDLLDAVVAGELEHNVADPALAALDRETPGGTRGAAFVLPGCADTGAVLHIDGSEVSAELTGGENVNCDVAVYFLAVFDIPTDDLPDDARLA